MSSIALWSSRVDFPTSISPCCIHVLRSMGAADLIEQAPDGLLITGLASARGSSRNHDFYVAFIVHEEYRVNHAGHHVGNIAFVPEFEEGKFLILAGRRWQILDIDHERKTITVRPSPGGRVLDFIDDGPGHSPPRPGDDESSPEAQDLPIYLDMKAKEMLLQARSTARDSGLLHSSFLQDGRMQSGSPGPALVSRERSWGLGKYFGGLKVSDEEVALVFEKTTVARVQEIYRGFLTNCPDAVALALQFPNRVQEKYERYLSDELSATLFARERWISRVPSQSFVQTCRAG